MRLFVKQLIPEEPVQQQEKTAEVADCPLCAPSACTGGAHRNAMVEDGVIQPGKEYKKNETAE